MISRHRRAPATSAISTRRRSTSRIPANRLRYSGTPAPIAIRITFEAWPIPNHMIITGRRARNGTVFRIWTGPLNSCSPILPRPAIVAATTATDVPRAEPSAARISETFRSVPSVEGSPYCQRWIPAFTTCTGEAATVSGSRPPSSRPARARAERGASCRSRTASGLEPVARTDRRPASPRMSRGRPSLRTMRWGDGKDTVSASTAPSAFVAIPTSLLPDVNNIYRSSQLYPAD